jgi:hypothetical protein
MPNHHIKVAAVLEQKLSFRGPKEISPKEIMGAHFLDFWMVLGATLLMKFTMETMLAQYMISASMKSSFSHFDSALVTSCLFPMLLTSYFYFSFFFNHGQTYGMNRMKIRIEMRENDFLDSYRWSIYSMKVAMTFGIFTFYAKKQPYKNHDYLYENMMVEKDWVAPNLAEAILSYQDSATLEEHELKEAA